MPVHNGAAFIRQAVRSALEQSSSDIELVVWDDGSTDDSARIAREAIGDDRRGRVMGSPHRRGQAAAFNSAAAATTAPLLAGLDADDWLATTAIAELRAFLDGHPETDLVYSDHLQTDASGRVVGLGERCTIPYSPERLLVSFMTFHLRVFRRSIYDKVGGIDESFPAATDYDFCLKVSEAGIISHLPRPLYFYRRHRAAIGLSKRLEQIEQAARAIRAALARRGLSDELTLDVELVGQFSLRPRQPDDGG